MNELNVVLTTGRSVKSTSANVMVPPAWSIMPECSARAALVAAIVGASLVPVIVIVNGATVTASFGV